MWWKGASRLDRTELDRLIGLVSQLTADVSRIETEWRDTKDQVRRSYQRLEKAAQRLDKAQPDVADPTPQAEVAPTPTDPFSQKMRLIEEQRRALSPGN